MNDANHNTARVRLDRWLWAARFFKTRSAAKAAIEGGKVHCGGQRAKPSKEIGIGIELVINRGSALQTVVVTGIGERRGTATDAARLYRETADSIAKREAAADRGRALWAPSAAPATRPDRRGRRELMRLKQSDAD